MSLWGNNDNLFSGGTVALNYNNKTVTGTGTTFGTVGAAKTGDVIRFGARGGGAAAYFGDAVIVGITSATVLSIGSTAGLSGAAISGVQYHVSELPSYTVGDHTYSNKHDTVATYKQFNTAIASDFTEINEKNVGIVDGFDGLGITVGSAGQDALLNDGNNIVIAAVGSGTVNTDAAVSPVGFSTVFVVAPPGIIADDGNFVTLTVGGVSAPQLITGIGATTVSIGGTISAQVNAATSLTFTGSNIISLASTVTAGIATGDTLTFNRLMGGYDRQIYGISTSSSGDYKVGHQGWVGVTTYTDMHGNFRVKSEVLVAMSGIQTGANGISYPTPQ